MSQSDSSDVVETAIENIDDDVADEADEDEEEKRTTSLWSLANVMIDLPDSLPNAYTVEIPIDWLVPKDGVWHDENGDNYWLHDSAIDEYWIEVNGEAMRDIADELVCYQAGTRMMEEYARRLTEECEQCGTCSSCVKRASLEAGYVALTVDDMVPIAESIDWVWFSLSLRANVRQLDEDRVSWLVDRKWNLRRLKLIAPRLEKYFLPVSRRNEAGHRLLDYVRSVGNMYRDKRRREELWSR